MHENNHRRKQRWMMPHEADRERSQLSQTCQRAEVVRLDTVDHHAGDLLRLHCPGSLRVIAVHLAGSITVGLVLGAAIIVAAIVLTLRQSQEMGAQARGWAPSCFSAIRGNVVDRSRGRRAAASIRRGLPDAGGARRSGGPPRTRRCRSPAARPRWRDG